MYPPHSKEISHSYVVFISVTSMMSFLATLFVIARFASRFLTIKYWWDDWTVLAALLFAYGPLAMIVLVATVGGAGHHISEYSPTQLERFLKMTLANNVLYNASITMSKISVLLFYRRVFSVECWLQVTTKALGLLLIGYFLAAAGGLVFANNPVEGQWNLAIPSTSIDNKAFWLSMAIFNISLDTAILALPQARVWKLQLSAIRRFLVSLIFLLGGLVCIMSIVRIVSLLTIDISDLTYTLTTPGIWTIVEMSTSIICSCLPIMPGLFRSREKPAQRSKTPVGSFGSGWLSAGPKGKGSGYTDIDGIDVETNIQIRYDSRSNILPMQNLPALRE